VAAGLSDFFGVDLTLVRALFVLATIFVGGTGALIYLVCWVLLPKGSTPASLTTPPPRRGSVYAIVVFALFVGAASAIDDNRTLIIAVIALILLAPLVRKIRGRHSWKAHKEFEKARLAWQRRLDEQANQAARPTYLGGDPFQIGSFYPPPPPNQDDNPNSGFQIQH